MNHHLVLARIDAAGASLGPVGQNGQLRLLVANEEARGARVEVWCNTPGLIERPRLAPVLLVRQHLAAVAIDEALAVACDVRGDANDDFLAQAGPAV